MVLRRPDRRRRRALAIAALLALPVAVWVWTASGGGPPPVAVPDPRAPGTRDAAAGIEGPASAPDRSGVAGTAPRDGVPDPEAARSGSTVEVIGLPVARSVDPRRFAGSRVELRARGREGSVPARARVARLDERLGALFERVDPVDLYDVWVLPENGLPSSRAGVSVAPGERARVEVELLAGATVFGRALDGQGRPLLAARVRVLSEDEGAPRPWERSVPTEPDGGFELSGIRPGRVQLEVRVNDVTHGQDLGWLEEAQTVGPVEVRVESLTYLEGTVRWPDGQPALEARVVATPADGQATRASETRTDAQGRFRLEGLTPVAHELIARPTRFHRDPLASAGMRAWQVAEPPARVELELRAGLTLRGRVVDDLGAAVPTFRVHAEPLSGARGAAWCELAEAIDQPAGTFELLGLRPGPLRLVASDRAGSASAALELDLRADQDGLVLVLPRPATVSGTVLDGAGRPVAQTWVYALGAGEAGALPRAPRRALSDHAGRFRVERVAPGRVRLSTKRGQGPGVELTLEAGELREGVELRSE